MLKDLFSAVQKSLSDRVRDPLFGSFIGFFTVWNWKPISIILLGSDLPFEDRLERVKLVYLFPKADLFDSAFPHSFALWGIGYFVASIFWNYGIPLLLSLAYLWLYPKVKKRVVVYVQRKETDIINAKRTEEYRIVPTPDEAERLRREIDRLVKLLVDTKSDKRHLPRTTEWIKRGAAYHYGGKPEFYSLCSCRPQDDSEIVAGSWMIMSPTSRRVSFYPEFLPNEDFPRACLILERLEGSLVLVAFEGNLSISEIPNPYGIVWTKDSSYSFSRKERGRLTEYGGANLTDIGLHHAIVITDPALERITILKRS